MRIRVEIGGRNVNPYPADRDHSPIYKQLGFVRDGVSPESKLFDIRTIVSPTLNDFEVP